MTKSASVEKASPTQQLAAMFKEVFEHTGREMPVEMVDKCHDFVNALLDAQYDVCAGE